MLIAVALVLLQLSANHSTEHMSSELKTLEQDLQSELFHHAEIIKGIAGIALQNPEIVSALKRKDRPALLHLSQKLMERFKLKQGETHLYFHDVQRHNLVRLCHPDQWGDLITRVPAIEAEESGEVAWGVVLGDCGSLSLHVVAPVFSEQRLVGYLEIGENIDRYAHHLQQLFGVEGYFLVDKQRTNRATYEAKQRAEGKISKWDQLPEQLVISWGDDELQPPLLQWMREHPPHSVQHAENFKMTGRHYHIAAMPITDAGGDHVAEAIILHDMTEHWASTYRLMMLIIAGIVIVGILLLALLYWFLLRVERQMAQEQQQSKDQLDELLEFQKLTVGRELRMEEVEVQNLALKQQVEHLESRAEDTDGVEIKR